MADTLPLAIAFAAGHPDAAARALEELAPEAVGTLLGALDAAAAAPVLAAMAPSAAAAALHGVSLRKIVERLRTLPPQSAAAILRAMEVPRRERVLAAMPKARQLQLGLVLRQPRRTVGAWMDSAIPSVRLDSAAGAVRERLARDGAAPTRLFVADGDRRHVGAVEAAKLLAAPDDAAIESLYTAGGPALRANVTLDAASDHPAWHDHDVLPVVDHAGRLVGAIRYATLRRATGDAAPGRPAGIHDEIGTAMQLANLLYLGMADAIDSTIAYRRPPSPAREETDQ